MVRILSIVFVFILLNIQSVIGAVWLDDIGCPVDGKIFYTSMNINGQTVTYESDVIDCESYNRIYSPNYCSYMLPIWEGLGDGYYHKYEVDFVCDSNGRVFIGGYKCFYEDNKLICPMVDFDNDFDVYKEDNKYYYLNKDTKTLRLFIK